MNKFIISLPVLLLLLPAQAVNFTPSTSFDSQFVQHIDNDEEEETMQDHIKQIAAQSERGLTTNANTIPVKSDRESYQKAYTQEQLERMPNLWDWSRGGKN